MGRICFLRRQKLLRVPPLETWPIKPTWGSTSNTPPLKQAMTVRRTPKRLALNRVDRIRNLAAKPHHSGAAMPTLCIRYKINPNKLSDFEEYARNWPKPIEHCGGNLIGYFRPTKLARQN